MPVREYMRICACTHVSGCVYTCKWVRAHACVYTQYITRIALAHRNMNIAERGGACVREVCEECVCMREFSACVSVVRVCMRMCACMRACMNACACVYVYVRAVCVEAQQV